MEDKAHLPIHRRIAWRLPRHTGAIKQRDDSLMTPLCMPGRQGVWACAGFTAGYGAARIVCREKNSLRIGLYAAVAENGVIGRDGDMPWHLSTDLKRFKATTMGKPVVMGRKTWESIGRPLPGRLNIVITRRQDFRPDGARVVSSLQEAIELARREGEGDEIAVIGGGEIYAQAIAHADLLHVTHVDAAVEGDTRFPSIDPAIWTPISSEQIPAGERDSYPTRHVIYARVGASSD